MNASTFFALSLCLLSPNLFGMDGREEKKLSAGRYKRSQEYKRQQFARQQREHSDRGTLSGSNSSNSSTSGQTTKSEKK